MAKRKTGENEYLYASARIHVLEGTLLTSDKYERLISAREDGQISRILGEYGYRAEEGESLTEAAERVMKQAFDEITVSAPVPRYFDIFRYPYDCNNLKTALKCEQTDGFTPEGLLSDCGSVPVKNLVKNTADRDFSAFPEHMAKAAPEAIALYSESGDPGDIDIPLDTACFADMAQNAAGSGDRAFTEYVLMKADGVNAVSALRCVRAGKPAGFFERIFVPGGSIGVKEFTSAFESEEKLFEKISPHMPVIAGMEGAGFTELEKRIDDSIINAVAGGKYAMFGPGALIGYLLAREYEIKNIRIIMSGGDDAGVRERLRRCYE